MKYNVTYSCGHTATVELFGKNADRENKLKWMSEKGLCPECYKAFLRQDDKEKAEEVLSESKLTLPTLTGTEKQIAYAEELRNYYIRDNAPGISTYARIKRIVDKGPRKVESAFASCGYDFVKAYASYREKIKLTEMVFAEADAGKVINAMKHRPEYGSEYGVHEAFMKLLEKVAAEIRSRRSVKEDET